MVKTYATALLLSAALAAPQVQAKMALSVTFTVSHTQGFNGADPASLSLSGGKLSGSVSVVAPGGPFGCTVNAGSTLVHNRLHLTCTIGPEEVVTLSGRLNPRTGLGKGRFAETFFKETGAYMSAKGN